MARWEAPWSAEQLEELRAFQADGRFHSYTCGVESTHPPLVPTPEGFVCEACGYRQGWAFDHDRMPRL